MKRHNLLICTRTTVSQQLPKDYKEKLARFRTSCKGKITVKKISREHINNDEVPLTFDIPTNRTVESTSPVSIAGNKKSSFTVVFSSQANGQKLPSMVISEKKLCQNKSFQLVSRQSQRVGWGYDWEKFTLRDRMAFSPTYRCSYWLATACTLISPTLFKTNWRKPIQSLPSFWVD